MSNKILSILTIIILLIIAGSVISTNNKSNRQDIIKIGVTVPLTGTNGFVGEGIKDAILLAQNKLQNTKYKYEVIFEDVQVDPKLAANAAQKLINIDKVDAIISAYAPVGNTIAPIAEKSQVVHIGIAFDPRAAEGNYNFIDFTTPDTSAKAFLAELKKQELTKLGVFRLNNPGILAVYNSIKALAPEYGISINFDEQFQPGERDFHSLIAKSRQNKSDIYVLLSIPPELDILAKQLIDMNIKNLTTAIYFELSPNKSLYEGMWSVGFGKTDSDFEKEFKDTYNKELSFGAANSYDVFNIIVRASEKYSGENKPSTKFIADNIMSLKNLEGVLGKLEINSVGIIDSSVQIKVVKNGVLVAIE
jgi:branched-chain amino acid transport system substrate-binding protein